MTCTTCKVSHAPYELRDGKCHSCTHAELAEYELRESKLTQSQLEAMLTNSGLVHPLAIDDPEGFEVGFNAGEWDEQQAAAKWNRRATTPNLLATS